MTIKAYIRFSDPEGETNYGEVSQEQLASSLDGLSVNVLEGTPFTGFQRTSQTKTVSKVRSIYLSREIERVLQINE